MKTVTLGIVVNKNNPYLIFADTGYSEFIHKARLFRDRQDMENHGRNAAAEVFNGTGIYVELMGEF